MSFFDSLIQNVKSLGGSQSRSVIGVDIGTSSIKVVQLRSSRGIAVLETYGEIALGPYAKEAIGKVVKLSPEVVAEALQELLKEANTTSIEASVSIPFSGTMMTIIDLPKVDTGTLQRIIPLEARKYIPVPITEVSLDWFAIPEENTVATSAFDAIRPKDALTKTKGQDVLLVAIQNSILQFMQTVSNNSGLQVDFYEIEVFSAIRASFEHGLAPIAFIDIGASTTKVYIVERGIVRLTHLIMIGGQQITETLGRAMKWEFEKAERIKREQGIKDNPSYSKNENDLIQGTMLSTLSRIFTEVNRVLLNYGQHSNKNVSRAILLGGGAALPDLQRVAQSSMNIETSIAHPFAHTEAPAFLDSILESIGPSFAVAVGLALRKLQQT